MKWLVTILFFIIVNFGYSQTMIEMTSPEDANLILLEVSDSAMADIYIYKTDKLYQAKEWDCMWKFKKFGFSNFAIYIAKDENEFHINEEQAIDGIEKTFVSQGKVYFVKNKENRGYKKGFTLEGVMKVTISRKVKVRKNELE